MATKTTERTSGRRKKRRKSKFKPADYWCEIVLEKTTQEKALDRKLPTDAFNVTYVVDGKEHI